MQIRQQCRWQQHRNQRLLTIADLVGSIQSQFGHDTSRIQPFATAAENKVSIAGIDFAGYIQLRVDADPTADTPTGTEKGGSTPFVITAKKDVTIKVYNRRQKGSNGYEAGDNKGLLCWDQAAAAKLSGTETFDKYEKDSEGNDNEDYGYVITSFKLSADKTYTLYRRGSTMRIFGIAFE